MKARGQPDGPRPQPHTRPAGPAPGFLEGASPPTHPPGPASCSPGAADPRRCPQCPTEPVRPRPPRSVPSCPHARGYATCLPCPAQTPEHSGMPLLRVPWHPCPRPHLLSPSPDHAGAAQRPFPGNTRGALTVLRNWISSSPSPPSAMAPACWPGRSRAQGARCPSRCPRYCSCCRCGRYCPEPGGGAPRRCRARAAVLHRGGGGGGRGLPATRCAEGDTGTRTRRARSGDCLTGSPARDCVGLAAGLARGGGAGAAEGRPLSGR